MSKHKPMPYIIQIISGNRWEEWHQPGRGFMSYSTERMAEGDAEDLDYGVEATTPPGTHWRVVDRRKMTSHRKSR